MPQLSYRCPRKGYRVQVFSAEEVLDTNADDYLTVLCTLCQQVHLLNRVSGEPFGEEYEPVARTLHLGSAGTF